MTGQKIVENFDNLDQFVHEEENFWNQYSFR